MLRRGFQAAVILGHHGTLPGVTHLLPRFNPASAFGSSAESLLQLVREHLVPQRTPLHPIEGIAPLRVPKTCFKRAATPHFPVVTHFRVRTAVDRAEVAPEVSRFCQEMKNSKNYALPNASWGPDMLSLYHKFLEKTKTDGWVRVPSFKSNRDHIQGFKLPLDLSANSDKSDWRLFTRCIEREGQGYEYVIFFQPSEKKSICLFQPGPYLEGVPGYAHGGSLAALIDETFSKTAYLSGEGLLTVNFNIRFKNLIPLGSLALLNVNVEKIEDQKIYLSCVTQSRDQQTVYAKASGIFLQMQLEEVISTIDTVPSGEPTNDHLAYQGPPTGQGGVPKK